MPHGYGAALALPIWVDAMNAAPSQKYPSPEMQGGWQGGMPAGPERAIQSVPGNILRSFRKFFGGHQDE
jgi:hypothetical protein